LSAFSRPKGFDDQTKGKNALADEVMERCIRIVANVNRFAGHH
jgi:hypothetical protein